MNMTNATPYASPAPLTLLPPLAISAAHVAGQARQQFVHLEQWLSSPHTLQLPLHQIECQQEHQGRELQRLLLQVALLVEQLFLSVQ